MGSCILPRWLTSWPVMLLFIEAWVMDLLFVRLNMIPNGSKVSLKSSVVRSQDGCMGTGTLALESSVHDFILLI